MMSQDEREECRLTGACKIGQPLSWLNKLTVGPNKMPFFSGLDDPFDVSENLMSISKICTLHEIANILVWCPPHMIQTLRQV